MDVVGSAQRPSGRGLLFILSAAVLWGTVGVTTQLIYGLADTSPLSVAWLRLALALPTLLAACALVLGRRALRVRPRGLGGMLVVGILLALYQICYFSAIPLIGVAVATLITLCAAPVLVALLSAALLLEGLGGRLVLALVCALAGTALLIDLGGGRPSGTPTALGLLLALASALGYALVTLSSRLLAPRHHPLQLVTVGFAAGAAILLPVAAWAGLALGYPLLGWGLLLYLGVVPTALAYLLFTVGMRSTSATAASIATLIEPVTAAGLAWILFGERLGPLALAGALLLLGAVVLLATGKGR
jgi:DME family drug/metabolite transporter